MELFEMFRQMGLAALISILVSFLPLIAAGAYLFKPTEQRLAMMRGGDPRIGLLEDGDHVVAVCTPLSVHASSRACHVTAR